MYLNEGDKWLERTKEATRLEGREVIEYARFADALVVLVNSDLRHDWLQKAVEKRLREEFAKLEVEVNEERSRKVDLTQGFDRSIPEA